LFSEKGKNAKACGKSERNIAANMSIQQKEFNESVIRSTADLTNWGWIQKALAGHQVKRDEFQNRFKKLQTDFLCSTPKGMSLFGCFF
jgi:hypothetical protein